MSSVCNLCGALREEGTRFCPACGSRFKEQVDKYDGFISYRREGGSHIATLLKLLLETGFGKRFFLDVDELQVGRFDEKLLGLIDSTPNFILILSAGCLDRCVEKNDWLKREILHALETNRNVIPVLVDGFTFLDQKRMELLPDAMLVLPSLQAVAYSHIHRESAVRKIAEYCVGSISITDAAQTSSRAQSESDAAWLLGARAEIETLNQGAVADTETSLDQQSGSALPVALLCLVEHWNKYQWVAEREALKQQVETITNVPLSQYSWSVVIRVLTVRFQQDAQVRTLLLTPKGDRFAIHYPRLAALWDSSLGEAIRSTLGIAATLRTPTDRAEMEWVEWMRSLESSLIGKPQGTSELRQLCATVDEVYSGTDRAKIEAGMTTLDKLPPALRPAVAQHLGRVISEKRRALISIRDEPGNCDAYAHIGTLFYWDLMRIATSGTEDERQLARDALWSTSGSEQVRGYAHIALYFLRHYLAMTPNGKMRGDVEKVITTLESIREATGKLAKEQKE